MPGQYLSDTTKMGNADSKILDKKQQSDPKDAHENDMMMKLHWDKSVERRGLGDLIYKANHIAIVVSDVGKSLAFYSDVLGMQQIRRPNFDRHGAWLTLGNIELHLIKGRPVVHSGDDLIVGHISLETFHIDKVLEKLKEMGITFRQNVSVPTAKEDGIVTQYFLTDPDGYYVELCNCDILTKFCLGEDKYDSFQYDEGVHPHVNIPTLAKTLQWAAHAKMFVKERNSPGSTPLGTPTMERKGCGDKLDAPNGGLGVSEPETEVDVDGIDIIVDEVKLQNLLKRTKVYGDIIQGETEDSLRKLLKSTRNNVPELITKLIEKKKDGQLFIPPAFYDQGDDLHVPPSFEM